MKNEIELKLKKQWRTLGDFAFNNRIDIDSLYNIDQLRKLENNKDYALFFLELDKIKDKMLTILMERHQNDWAKDIIKIKKRMNSAEGQWYHGDFSA